MRIKPFLLLLAMNIVAFSAESLDLGNFQKTPWHGMQAVNGPCPVPLPQGLAADTPVACWKDLPKNPTLMAPKMPENLSGYTHFNFWLYSSKKNNQGITIYFDSEDPKSEGGDYYYYHLTVDWEVGGISIFPRRMILEYPENRSDGTTYPPFASIRPDGATSQLHPPFSILPASA